MFLETISTPSVTNEELMINQLLAHNIITPAEREGLEFLLASDYQFHNFLTKYLIMASPIEAIQKEINNYDNYYADPLPKSFMIKQATRNIPIKMRWSVYKDALNKEDNLVLPTQSKLYFIFIHELYNKPYLQTIKDALAEIRKEEEFSFQYHIFPSMAAADLTAAFTLPLLKIGIQIDKAFDYIIISAAASKYKLKNNFGILNLGKFLIAHLFLIVAATLRLPTIIAIGFINVNIGALTGLAASCYKIYSHADNAQGFKDKAINHLLSVPKYLLSAAIAGLIVAANFLIYIPINAPLAAVFAIFVVLPTIKTIYSEIRNIYNNYSPLNIIEKSNSYLKEIEALSRESILNIANDIPKNVNRLQEQLELAQDKLKLALKFNNFFMAYMAMRRLHDYLTFIPDANVTHNERLNVLKALKDASSDFSPLSSDNMVSNSKSGQALNDRQVLFINNLILILSKATNEPGPVDQEPNIFATDLSGAAKRIIFSAPRKAQKDRTLQNLAMNPDGKYNYTAPTRSEKPMLKLENKL